MAAILITILRVILWILLAVLGIIVLACIFPISAKVSYIDEKLSYKAAYWIVPLINSDGGGLLNRLRRRRKKPSKDDDNDNEDNDFDDIDDIDDIEIEEVPELSEHPDDENIPGEDSDETDIPEEDITEYMNDEDLTEEPEEESSEKKGKSLGDKLELISNIWEAADRPVLKIFKGFHFSDIYIDFIVANEDAYKCAVNYGMVSGTVYNLLAWLGALFTLRFKTVDINAGFALKKSRWDISAKVKFRLGTLVIAGIWFLITYLFKIYIPNKISTKKSRTAQSAE
ncbi:MAG: hypothetical protein IJ666_06885 [Ruminococcus sp.]|nr:hypothetical protein [Ruminococcus sp.]